MCGVPDVTKIEEQLANFIANRIELRLVPEIHIIPFRRTHVLAVELFPSPSRPHYVKAVDYPAGVYVRVGSTNRQADAAAVAELQRVVRGRSYDEEPLPELHSEVIELKGVRHREVWEFPVVALREAITNAFVHADYT